MPAVLFVNIAWMKFYDGPRDDDRLMPGNFGYFRSARRGAKLIGHEQWNFQPHDNQVLGYVPRSSGVNISRLGALRQQDVVKGVLVVFVARDPAADQLRVVGWYENATVARDCRFARVIDGVRIESPITAVAEDAYLLHVADRGRVTIPTAQTTPGGIGQAPLWYADHHPDVIDEVLTLIADAKRRKVRKASPSHAPRNMDLEARLAVEKISMEMAMAYFDGAVDVSRKKLGWDIEASSIHGKVYVEVKGLSGPNLVIELTPREYEKMLEHRQRYVLFVVTSTLKKSAVIRIFRFRASPKGGHGEWRDDSGTRLSITPRTGAICQI